MNAPIAIEIDLITELKTPFSLSPHVSPRTYLSGLGIFPGLPTNAVKPLVEASERKAIQKLINELDQTFTTMTANDVVDARTRAQRHFQSQNPAEMLMGEEVLRASQDMSIEAFVANRNRHSELHAEVRHFAAELSQKLGKRLLPSFVEEVQAQETRLAKFGQSLSETVWQDGQHLEVWVLHSDFILSSLFEGVHNLLFYWPQAFVNGHDEGVALDWVQKLIAED
jgi:hypothetical protein